MAPDQKAFASYYTEIASTRRRNNFSRLGFLARLQPAPPGTVTRAAPLGTHHAHSYRASGLNSHDLHSHHPPQRTGHDRRSRYQPGRPFLPETPGTNPAETAPHPPPPRVATDETPLVPVNQKTPNLPAPMTVINVESFTFVYPVQPRQQSAFDSSQFLTRSEARYWNAKLDQWLFTRNVRRKLNLRDSIRADVKSAATK